MRKVLKAPLFPIHYHLIAGTKVERNDQLSDLFSNRLKTKVNGNEVGKSYAVVNEVTKERTLVIELAPNATLMTVIHECIHMAHRIMSIVGAEDEEVLCYLHEDLVAEVTKALDEEMHRFFEMSLTSLSMSLHSSGITAKVERDGDE